MTNPLHGAHPKITRQSDRRIAVRRRRTNGTFFEKITKFLKFFKKRCPGFTCFFKKPTAPKKTIFSIFLAFRRGRFFEKTGETTPHFFFPKNPKISRFRQKKRHFPSLRTTILLSDCLVILGWAPCRRIVIQGTSKMRIFFTRISFLVQFGQEFTSKMAKNLCFSQKVG